MNSNVERASIASRAPQNRRSGPLRIRQVNRAATAARTSTTAQACACGHQNHSTYRASWIRVCPPDFDDDE